MSLCPNAGFVRIIYALSFSVTSVLKPSRLQASAFGELAHRRVSMATEIQMIEKQKQRRMWACIVRLHSSEEHSFLQGNHSLLSYNESTCRLHFKKHCAFCRSRTGTCIDTQDGMSHKVWAAAYRNTFLLLSRHNSAPNSHVIKVALPMLSRFCFCFMFITCCTCNWAFPLYWCLLFSKVCSLLWPSSVLHDPELTWYPRLLSAVLLLRKGFHFST